MVMMFLFTQTVFASTEIPDQTSKYVNDFADILTDEEEQTIVQNAEALEEEYEGTQIVVTTVPNTGDMEADDYSFEMYDKYKIGKNSMGILILFSNGEKIESYANDMFNDIGIGKEEEDNGLLLLIYKDKDPEESKVRIEVGMGFEGFITDSISGRVLDDYFVPYREKNDYDNATSYTTQALVGLIAKEYDVGISGVTIEDEKIEELQEDEEFSIPWPVIAVIIVLVILDFIFNDGNITLMVLYALSSSGSSGGRSGGGGRSAGGGASR